MHNFEYDLVVIGSGPAGQRAAIQGAKLDKRVALVERKAVIGGVCINTGTIPSKTLREAVLHLSGYRERGLYGASYTVKQNITMDDLLFRTDHVIRHEIDVTRHQLMRNRVEVLAAEASFVDPHTVRLNYVDGRGLRDVTTANVVVATGTNATKDEHIPFDERRIFISDDILRLDRLPRTLTVIGAGVIGCEYASIFAALGVRVTLIDKRPRLLPFVDSELVEALAYHMRQNRVTLRLGEEVGGIEPFEDEHGERVRIHLVSGKQIVTEKALHSIGRTGATRKLNLPVAGLEADSRGRLKVNSHYQTEVPHIYAVGDVIGFPSLASTSMEQGRLAVCHAFGVETNSVPELFPYGIYTIPEISMVGRNEEELTEQGIPYEVGKAQYREIARGQIIGDNTGLLKLIFHLDTRQLLGVHIIGEGASELVHIGQAVLTFGGKIEYFVNTVFNYPTLAECYKTAAFDGINRLGW
ncbi:MAG: Si-specific NAD(P)(+) transhydrogenase [Anaerolineae bacterium]|nr:Si-specific NAD(P)(+) transhydrogenase [Anaerolineales bacterium]MCQ3976448.1 Si-specific NAD(P)(+) transhydrogenase [Anaerolineae bacterium]